MQSRSGILWGMCIFLATAAWAQNQSPMKTTNQKNINVQKKNDEAEMERIRSKTPKTKGKGDQVSKHDTAGRSPVDSMGK